MRQLRIINVLFAIVAILLGCFAIYLAIKWDSAIRDLHKHQVLVDSLYNNYEIARTHAAQSAGLLRALSDSNMKTYKLKGMPSAPNQSALLFWNSEDGQVYLNPFNLSFKSSNQFYQLWAIENDEPVSLGLIDMTKSPYLIQRMRDVTNPEEFFINTVVGVEKRRPLLEKIVVTSE